jgi:hypothetical protein
MARKRSLLGCAASLLACPRARGRGSKVCLLVFDLSGNAMLSNAPGLAMYTQSAVLGR